ncbi:hypothetical protein ILP92_12395 [Maribius pontilimi]|uniref:Glycosyl transferase family 2 n=1 Tax=Palleronia pontilimi TaxID=1964209 RepID=A0A934MAF2_9RHOB|nr:glycosyltransferase family 2 protein [Palleronia pontilimi]MBJ3763547.1 hypothetical protein [Palleronia pontilimi]
MSDIAAFTLVRNDSYFLRKCIDHYGAAFGLQALFVLRHGSDWTMPALPPGVNVLTFDGPMPRGPRNDWSAALCSDFAAFLLGQYKAVVRADTDEFLVADPQSGLSLADAILAERDQGCISALGIDVIHDIANESALSQEAGSILAQRRHGVITREFTKPCVVFHPAT